MIPAEAVTNQTMTRKRAAVALVALCVLAGVAVGTLGLLSTEAPGTAGGAAGGAGAADASAAAANGSMVTDSSAAASGDAAAAGNASDSSGERASDCDLIDVDGNDNTVSVNISNDTSDGVSIQYRCGAGNATALDHDLIDIDGNNNSVTVVVGVENGTVVFGENGSAADSNGLHVALQCGGDTAADCDAVDIDGHNNTVTLVVLGDDGRTVHEFGTNSSDTA